MSHIQKRAAAAKRRPVKPKGSVFKASHLQQPAPSTSSNGSTTNWAQIGKTLLGFLGLFMIVPVIFGLATILPKTVYFLEGLDWMYPFLWSGEGLVWVGIWYLKWSKHTFDSWFTFLLIWGIVAMGTSMLFTNLLTTPSEKSAFLRFWMSLTFVPYLVYIYYDQTDHVKREKKEQREEKLQEKKEQKWLEMRKQSAKPKTK